MDPGSHRVWVLPTLAAAVVLAGCSAGIGTDATATRSVTPAPVPGDATPAVEGVTPGVSPDGVENASSLEAAHRRELSGVSFTERTVTTVRDANGTVIGQRTLVVRRDAEAFRLRFGLEGDLRVGFEPRQAVAVDVWSDGETVVQSITARDGSVRREPAPNTFYSRFAIPGVEPYARTLERASFRRVDRRVENGTVLYVFEADGVDSIGTFGLLETTSTGNATLRAVVGEDGVTRLVVVTFPARHGGRSATVEHVFEVTAIGTTTVPRPPWYDGVVENGTSAPRTRSGVEWG
jgi:hypothetical protein